MFPSRFFAPRFFAPRFWPVGADVVEGEAAIVRLEETRRIRTLDRRDFSLSETRRIRVVDVRPI